MQDVDIVAVGVDSHKATLAAAAVTAVGAVLGVREFPNSSSGHRQLIAWVVGFGKSPTIGIECSATYGAALARFLVAGGHDVVEVPSVRAHREALRTPSRGKSDPADAVAIARVVARGEDLYNVRPHPKGRDLKLLSDLRSDLVTERTRIKNRIHAHLVVIAPDYRTRIPNLSSHRSLAKVRALVRPESSVLAEVVLLWVGELERLNTCIAGLEARIKAEVEATGTALTSFAGVGYMTAARILGEVQDISRIRSKAAFARLAGAAPVPASSGQTVRHRHDRGGNRQLNCALHLIAVNRCRLDEETRSYVARRQREGKTKKAALRSLKRHLCNRIYRILMDDFARFAAA